MKAISTAVLLWALCARAQTRSDAPLMTDAQIREALTERIDVQHQGVGIVVGVVDAHGRRVISYGALNQGDNRPLNGDTVFEIGSVSKVFTSLLLADMVRRGEVALTDPVAKFLPSGTKVPERGGRQITLQDLATQSSGLPRLPSNLKPKDPTNPYADYTVEQLYQFLATYQLTRDIGAQYEYSNLGVGLLGHALARRAGMDYETLVRTRIAEPLGMKSTGITLSPEMKSRLAVGHNADLKAVANWDLPTLAGAGALRSSANDMLNFVAAHLGYTATPLAPAMADMIAVRRPTGSPGLEIGLAWHIFTGPNELVWHNGGTGGYRSFLGYSTKTRVGVVVLSNVSNVSGVDDIGLHILDPSRPLLATHKEVSVNTKLYDGYVGHYQIRPNFILEVTRDGDHLYTQATGQPRFEIFPSGDRDFFVKVFDAQLTFETDAQGRATQVVLHQGGANTPAKRMEGEPPAPAHQEVHIDPKLYDALTGKFQLAPNFALTVTREGGHLFVQATNQPKFELFAESDRKFFFKVVDAQIDFTLDEKGRALSLVLHQNGMDMPGPRVP